MTDEPFTGVRVVAGIAVGIGLGYVFLGALKSLGFFRRAPYRRAAISSTRCNWLGQPCVDDGGCADCGEADP